MKVLVCGGRDYADRNNIFDTLDSLHEDTAITTIIHGGARGADSLADAWARSRGIKTHVFFPDWDKYGNAAGPIRNQQMLKEGNPDYVVAFPGGKGTEHMISIAQSAGLRIY